MGTHNVNIGRNWVKDIWELSAIFVTFPKSKIISKHKVKESAGVGSSRCGIVTQEHHQRPKIFLLLFHYVSFPCSFFFFTLGLSEY